MSYADQSITEQTIAVGAVVGTIDTFRPANASIMWLAVENLDASQTVTVTVEGRLTPGTGSWFSILWNGIGAVTALGLAMDFANIFGVGEIRVRALASGAGCNIKYSRRLGYSNDAPRR